MRAQRLLRSGRFVFVRFGKWAGGQYVEPRLLLRNEPGVSGGYPKFDAVMYSVDAFVPLVDLHQASTWLPNANRPWGGALRWYLWFHIVAGWTLTTLLVVGLTGLVRR